MNWQIHPRVRLSEHNDVATSAAFSGLVLITTGFRFCNTCEYLLGSGNLRVHDLVIGQIEKE